MDLSLFGFFFMMMLFKGIFAAAAGPAPNYDMQKDIVIPITKRSIKDDWICFDHIIACSLFHDHWIDGAGRCFILTRLNLSNGAGGIDFERVLPATINNFLPPVILGIVLTGLLGAFMGTFSGTLNAAQAYIVNDIYLKYVNPTASNKQNNFHELYHRVLLWWPSVSFLGFLQRMSMTVFQWIVAGLYGGYVAANCLKWYWWRFNANGFFWGMAVWYCRRIGHAVCN